MKIPFTKAHGAKNDFLLTWQPEAPEVSAFSQLAQAICARNTGVGADGWYWMSPHEDGADLRIRLFNADGGEVEMSGNGTRCAAAWALVRGLATGGLVKIATGSGVKAVELLERQGMKFLFRMDMGVPRVVAEQEWIEAAGKNWDATLVDVGNPQCAVFVESFDEDWVAAGAALERHPRFPKRTNVSFVKRLSDSSIEVRFFERGVGVTNSSGTGSTGAMVASVLRGHVKSPVDVITPAGTLQLSWEQTIYLVGPAELTAEGVFYFEEA